MVLWWNYIMYMGTFSEEAHWLWAYVEPQTVFGFCTNISMASLAVRRELRLPINPLSLEIISVPGDIKIGGGVQES